MNRYQLNLLLGSFLSALVNIHYEQTQRKETYLLFTTEEVDDFEDANRHLGFRNNGANILINGNAGDYLGEEMISGKITVLGKAKSHIGQDMKGGKIYVQRGCETLYLNKTDCSGGEIYIEGNIGNIVEQPFPHLHKIWHNGERLNP